jgi:hypothetical protein
MKFRYQEEKIGLLEPLSKAWFPPISIIAISKQNKKFNEKIYLVKRNTGYQ